MFEPDLVLILHTQDKANISFQFKITKTGSMRWCTMTTKSVDL